MVDGEQERANGLSGLEQVCSKVPIFNIIFVSHHLPSS